MIILIISIICLVFSVTSYFIFGIEKKSFAGIQTESPKDLSPLEVSLIYNKKIVGTDIILMMYYFYSKGYLKINKTDNKDACIYEKVKEYDGNNLIEKYLFNRIFTDSVVDLNKIQDIKLISYFIQLVFLSDNIYTKIFNSKSLTAKKISRIINYLIIVIINIYSVCIYPENGLVFSIFCIAFAFGFTIFDVFGVYIFGSNNESEISFWENDRVNRGLGRVKNNISASLVIILVTFLIKSLLIIFASHQSLTSRILFVLILLVCEIIICISQMIGSSIDKKTDFGQKLYHEVVNYKNYLNSVEKERFAVLYDTNPNVFRKDSVFGYVFGISDKWTNKFEVNEFKNLFRIINKEDNDTQLKDFEARNPNKPASYTNLMFKPDLDLLNKLIIGGNLKMFGIDLKEPIVDLKVTDLTKSYIPLQRAIFKQIIS